MNMTVLRKLIASSRDVNTILRASEEEFVIRRASVAKNKSARERERFTPNSARDGYVKICFRVARVTDLLCFRGGALHTPGARAPVVNAPSHKRAPTVLSSYLAVRH